MRSSELPASIKPYKTDHSIVYRCQYHVIWCPKFRRRILVPPIDTRLKELILEKQSAYGYEVLAMEVMPDHVHLLLDVDPRIGIHKIVGQIKGWTSRAIGQEFPFVKRKLPSLWTRSQFMATVGTVSLEVVKQYIGNQKAG
jgi:putative transposase